MFFQTFVEWNHENALYLPERFLYKCRKEVVSPPPNPVENFTIVSYQIVDNRRSIHLTMEWSPPSEPNGELAAYNVCIGSEPLDPQEEVQQHSLHICGDLDVSHLFCSLYISYEHAHIHSREPTQSHCTFSIEFVFLCK